jgi:hypothetical protein
MRYALIVSAAGILVSTSARAANFTIVSGDLHAEATHAGVVPPEHDTPSDVVLSPAVTSGSVSAQLPSGVPASSEADFSSSGGVTLNTASLSLNGHGKGDGGALLQGTGAGSGSVDLVFSLNAPAQVHFQGSNSLGSLDLGGFNASASLLSNGSVISTLPFTVQGPHLSQLDLVESLAAGSYELTGSASVTASTNDASGSESITATIVPEPSGLSLLALAILARRRMRRG